MVTEESESYQRNFFKNQLVKKLRFVLGQEKEQFEEIKKKSRNMKPFLKFFQSFKVDKPINLLKETNNFNSLIQTKRMVSKVQKQSTFLIKKIQTLGSSTLNNDYKIIEPNTKKNSLERCV